MKKIMIMMVMMLTIVVSTSGKNTTNVKNDRNNVVVVNKTIVRHDDNKCCKYGNHDRGTSWREKKVVCKCKCHRKNTCCKSHNRPCKKCFKMMKKGTHPYIR